MTSVSPLDLVDRLNQAAAKIAIVRAGIESDGFNHPRAPSGSSWILAEVIEEMEEIAESIRPTRVEVAA